MYACQVPRAKNPDVAGQLIEAAARLLADEGESAVTARRLGKEVGSSTMAVYTHFGSMDDLLLQVWQEGFVRFGRALDGPAVTDDPIADFVAQGWAYRRFALDNRHLYRVMFDGLLSCRVDDAAALDVARGTFQALLDRLQRAVDAGRLTVGDLELAGQVVWATVHGHVSIELTGYFDTLQRDPEKVYAECLRRLALAFGDQPEQLTRSIKAGTRRARAVFGRGRTGW
jgi:AcrR family transcriptional regulator